MSDQRTESAAKGFCPLSVINEGSQVSYLLKRAVNALDRIATSDADLTEKQRFDPAAKYQLSRSVLKRE